MTDSERSQLTYHPQVMTGVQPPLSMPSVRMSNGNRALILHKGLMEVRLIDHYSVREDDEPFVVDGLLQYEFAPTESITFRFSDLERSPNPLWRVLDESDPLVWKIRVNVLGLGLEVFADFDEESRIGYVRPPKFVRLPTVALHTMDDPCVHYMTFHLVNLPHIQGHPIRTKPGSIRPASDTLGGRHLLSADGWQVTVDGVISKPSVQSFLRRVGGFAITHVGKLNRIGGMSFSFKEGLTFLDELSYFYAFVARRRTEPMLPIAYDASDQPIIEEWSGDYLIDEWQRHTDGSSWSASASAQQLEDAFGGYWRLLSVPAWHENIELALRWYLQSFAGSTNEETAIVLSVAGLELIATLVLRELRIKRPSNTAPRLRKFLKSIGVSLAIPESLDSLLTMAGIDDGPQLAVEFRNGLVHGNRPQRSSSAPSQAVIDAAHLTRWYLEIALLRLFNYQGTYWNTLERSHDVVPWNGSVTDWRDLAGGRR